MLATKTAEYSAGSSETTAVEVLLAVEDDRSAEPELARTEEGPRVVWAVDEAGVVYLPQEEGVRMQVVRADPYDPYEPHHVLNAAPRSRGWRSTRRCYACGATRAEHPSEFLPDLRALRPQSTVPSERAMVPPAAGADSSTDSSTSLAVAELHRYVHGPRELDGYSREERSDGSWVRHSPGPAPPRRRWLRPGLQSSGTRS